MQEKRIGANKRTGSRLTAFGRASARLFYERIMDMNTGERLDRGDLLAEWSFQGWLDSLSSEALAILQFSIGLPSRSVKELQPINWQKEGF